MGGNPPSGVLLSMMCFFFGSREGVLIDDLFGGIGVLFSFYLSYVLFILGGVFCYWGDFAGRGVRLVGWMLGC